MPFQIVSANFPQETALDYLGLIQDYTECVEQVPTEHLCCRPVSDSMIAVLLSIFSKCYITQLRIWLV